VKVERFSQEAQERSGERKLSIGSRGRRKALKGEAQECWVLKEGFKGGKS